MSGFRIVLVAGVVALFGGATGCEWFHRAEADRHEKNAEEAAKKGNFGEMIDEGKKADKADKAAKGEP